jgi:hypothetical protein
MRLQAARLYLSDMHPMDVKEEGAQSSLEFLEIILVY